MQIDWKSVLSLMLLIFFYNLDNFWLFLIKSFKKFICWYTKNIDVFWYKNIKHSFYLIFRYYVSLLFIVCIYFLFFKFISSTLICDDNILGKTPVELGIFSEIHLLDFYVPEKYLEENLEKLCFSEGVAALVFNLIEIQNPDDRILPLRQILGREYYENFKKFSYYVFQDAHNITSINIFLDKLIYREKFVDKEFLNYRLNNFLFDHYKFYKKEWYPKMSLRQEILYYREFWVLEELRPLSIPRLFNFYNRATNSSKFFKYVYYNDIICGYYTDYGKSLLKNFTNIRGQDLSEIYFKAYSYSFDQQKGFIYKVKNLLQHLFKLKRLYEKEAAEYYFLCGNLCFDETDILNFVYLDIYITANKEIYTQALKEIEFTQTLNVIFYYPAVATGRYYIKEVIKGLKLYLQACLDNGVFKDTDDDYIYVETLHGDHRVRRLIKRYLNLILKSCLIKDEKTIALYKKHAPIFYSILSDNKNLLTKKITYKQALEAINFIDNIINKIKKEEDFLARKHFPNIYEIRKKKIYTKHVVTYIDEEKDKVYWMYYGPQSKNL